MVNSAQASDIFSDAPMRFSILNLSTIAQTEDLHLVTVIPVPRTTCNEIKQNNHNEVIGASLSGMVQ